MQAAGNRQQAAGSAEGGVRKAEQSLTCVAAPTNTGGTRLVVTGSLRPGYILHFAGVEVSYSGGLLCVRSGRHGDVTIEPKHPHKATLICLPADADSAPAMTDDRGRFRVCETASGAAEGDDANRQSPIENRKSTDPPLCLFGPGGDFQRVWPR